MRVSGQGLEFIARFEGYRARAYNDQAGNATIGIGHLLHIGPVRLKDRLLYWPYRTALAFLRKDAARADAAVNAYARRDLTQAQHDALVSFTYNCGAGALARSTLLKRVNAKASPELIAKAFEEWDYAGSVVSTGLLTRRNAEAKLYNEGLYT